MKVEVLSLGGSVIIPTYTDQIDYNYLKKLKRLFASIKDRKFVIVVGGGSTSRKYMKALEQEGFDKKTQSVFGISVTRMNAKFMAYFFYGLASQSIPRSLLEVKNLLKHNKIVFTGGLRYEEDNTSDGTAARIANYLNTDFINITDVDGLYTKDPRKFKDAKLINHISFEDFDKMIKQITFHPGQHFVLDQHASAIIKRNKIRTTIIGKDIENIQRCLNDKDFKGTVIE
ncbi:MAG: UMP kinase [Candidatus Woesearchaeota archaeon]|nr:UMP kinase [Candidatus Woesearchaeota archaeon]